MSTTSEISVQFSSPRSLNRFSINRVEGVQIPSMPSTAPIDVGVDLDAGDDRSEYSTGSRTSVSTSGVSSLLPRTYRNEHTLVRPSPVDYRPGYIGQRNSSNTRKRDNSEMWTDLDRSKNSPPGLTPPTSKRMRTENTQGSSYSIFSSPFYHGKVSYGGAASLRSAIHSRNVFEVRCVISPINGLKPRFKIP